MIGTWQRLAALAAVLTIATGCAATPASIAPPPGGSVAVVPGSSVGDDLGLSPEPSPLPPPTTPTVHPSPPPTPAPITWSKPTLIRQGECGDMTAAIDSAGRYHVAAVCDGGIRYLTSSDGIDWKETSFVQPIDRLEVGPQVTLDGDTVYIAYTRLAPVDGGCGDDGLEDLGVYTRSRNLPDGTWTDPVRVGHKGDHLQSFRVANAVLHLTVSSQDGAGPIFYESQNGPVFTEVLIPHAVSTSLRIGDDGHPRIAYATGHSIRFARVDGAKLVVKTVAASDETNLMGPSLVLGPGDRAYMVWMQTTDGGGGCVGPDPGPLDGVYFGTDASGAWKTTRLSPEPNGASLTLDPSSGRIDVVIPDGPHLTRFSSFGGTTWTSARIAGTAGMYAGAIRVNPLTHGLSLFTFDADDTGIYLLTRP
jgi:hypothetical protein